MFRQRLRGGHRVGSHSKPASSQPQNVHHFMPQSDATSSFASGNVNTDGAWNWDAPGSTTVHKNQPSSQQQQQQQHFPPGFYGANVQQGSISTPAQSHHPTNTSSSHVAANNSKNQISQINGAESQTPKQDEWNWGNEENWGEWSTNDAPLIPNTANNQQHVQPPMSYHDSQSQSHDNKPYNYYNYYSHSGDNTSNYNFQDPNKNSWNNNSEKSYYEHHSNEAAENAAISDHHTSLINSQTNIHSKDFPTEESNKNSWNNNSEKSYYQHHSSETTENASHDTTAMMNYQSNIQTDDVPNQEPCDTIASSGISSNFYLQESYAHTVTSPSQTNIETHHQQESSSQSFDFYNQNVTVDSFKHEEMVAHNVNDEVNFALKEEMSHQPYTYEQHPVPAGQMHDIPSNVSDSEQQLSSNTRTNQVDSSHPSRDEWNWDPSEWDADVQQSSAVASSNITDSLSVTNITEESNKGGEAQYCSQGTGNPITESWENDWNNIQVENSISEKNVQEERVVQNSEIDSLQQNNSESVDVDSNHRTAEEKENIDSVPPFGTWDDEWGDGWEIKPNQDLCSDPDSHPSSKPSTEAEFVRPYHPFSEEMVPDSFHTEATQCPEIYFGKRELYERVRGISMSDSLPEVPNIETLNQELHGIFSVPSESSLVLLPEVQDTGTQEIPSLKTQSSDENVDQNIFPPMPVFPKTNTEIKENPEEHEVPTLNVKTDFSLETAAESINSKEASQIPLANVASSEGAGQEDSSSGKPDYQLPSMIQENSASLKESFPSHSNEEKIESPSLTTAESSSQSSHTILHQSGYSQQPRPPSSHSSTSFSRPASNQSAHSNLMQPECAQGMPSRSSSKGDMSPLRNPTPTDLSPLTLGPSGTIPTLQARKGSPFQPPISRRCVAPTQESSGISPFPSEEEAGKPLSCKSEPPSLNSEESVGGENTLLTQPEFPEQNVRLAVAMRGVPPVESGRQTLSGNSIPLVIPGLIKNEPASSDTVSASKPAPPAHIANLPPQVLPPRVHTLNSVDNTPTSPSVLDLTQFPPAKQEPSDPPPTFSRMVPGESTKGESTAPPQYQAPMVVPAMPSGRVVTGNAYPQPIPVARVKQEPSEVRSPPDGPDTGNSVDSSAGVIPPVRSETIGSEEHVTRPAAPDRREDKDSSRRDRDAWDRDRDYYSDRYRERKRDARDYYRDESPRAVRRINDRDYDPAFDERRHHRREMDDDDDLDEDDRKYAEGKRERRQKAYRDELERYGDRGYGRLKDRRRNDPRDRDYHHHHHHHYSHDDEDPYFEGRSDRSRPTSRSSSFGNLVDADSGPGSHSPHHDDYFDRTPRGRERDPRDRDGPFREYPRYRRREGKERDPAYVRAYHPYPDQYGSRDLYDPQSHYYYYQYQKYLEQHPYYREYYRQYYGRYGYATGESLADDKASTRSGRSSVNDELKKSSLSSQFRQDFLDESSLGNFEPSSIYPEHASFSYKSYPSGDVSGVPSVTDEAGSDAHQRMSPQLFTGPHLTASFTPGGKLLLVNPNDPKEGEKPTVQIRNVQKMLIVDNEYASRIQKMKTYPGPLTVKDTHKDTVLRFCESKAKEAMNDDTLPDKDSVILMWEYLSLLVKQNGNVCGADLANLLIKKRTGTVQESFSLNATHSEERSKDLGISTEERPRNEEVVDEGQLHTPSPCQTDLINKFTEYLCLGRKKEAVDYAISQGLWSYAMTLAAKMDPVTNARVMSAFIHSIPSTDVLQTLIQHLSGKKPEVTKNYCEKKWGDWRQHLAMIVSNHTNNPQRDKASIIALGDTLAARNRIHAAHLCYLAAEVEWGTFSEKDSKLVLVGSSPHQPFQLFASDDAIQCTEIYEFAKSLDTNTPMFKTFQSYKLIYALRLTECGFPNEALKYCEVISAAVIKEPTAFQLDFVSQVLELASQLKYHDVHYQMGEGEVADMPDPTWIQDLQNILYNLQCQAAEAASLSATTASLPNDESRKHGTVRDSYSSNEAVGMSHGATEYGSQYLHGEGDQRGEQNSYLTTSVTPDINNESNFYGINTNNSPEYEDRMNASENITYDSLPPALRKDSLPTANNFGPQSLPIENVGLQQQPPQPSYQPYLQTQQSSESTYSNSNHSWSAASQQQQQQQQPQHWQSQPEMPPNATQQQDQLQHSTVTTHPPQWQANQQQPYQNMWQPDGPNPSQWHIQGGNAEETSRDAGPPSTPAHSAPDRTAEEEEYWAIMTGKDRTTPQTTTTTTDQVDNNVQKEEPPRKSSEDESEGKTEDKKGFFGSLFGGWRKSGNQAKLPDDKNPSIVWDEQKKKWVNKDGEDTDDSPLPPPPSSLPQGPPPALNSLRGGARKSRYVDPVGEKGRTKTLASPMLPPMPGATPPLMPPMNQPPPLPERPMEDPHVPAHNFISAESSQMSSQVAGTSQPSQPLPHPGVQEIKDTDETNADSIPMMTLGAPQGPPMFINPAQFRPAPNANTTQPKRTGPARRAFNVQR